MTNLYRPKAPNFIQAQCAQGKTSPKDADFLVRMKLKHYLSNFLKRLLEIPMPLVSYGVTKESRGITFAKI